MLEGLLHSYHAMFGLPYVALRYFNVYGPRMDLHGKYTEVLIRWMDRIANGQPPLIFGDGLQSRSSQAPNLVAILVAAAWVVAIIAVALIRNGRDFGTPAFFGPIRAKTSSSRPSSRISVAVSPSRRRASRSRRRGHASAR